MPRFEPFAGLRYDTARVDLSMVVAPPYDVIGPQDRTRLAARHSVNVVGIDVPEPDHRAELDRYANAARQLEQWQEEAILIRDPEPSFYAYRMTSPGGHATNGVIGALGIDEQSAGEILPHEQTLPKAKSDRLELMRATGANLSPIWGLSLSAGLTKTFLRDTPPDATATDDDQVRHDLWVITEPAMVNAVRETVATAPVVVADGHHRYETALTYRQELSGRSVPRMAGGQGDADAVMALVVELAEDQLEVGPIHRGLTGLPDGLDLVDAFSSWFDVTRAGDFDERTTGALGESNALALVMPSGAWLLSPKDGTPEAAGADLDSSMVALVIAELPEHDLEFFNSWRDAVGAVASDQAQAVVLLRPVSVDQIAEWAHTGRRMPPKSTYFHPKPRTGMVFRTLEARDAAAGPHQP
jgi:uncharacterized protein (DUF1015 family)